jgi:hypothetical protein
VLTVALLFVGGVDEVPQSIAYQAAAMKLRTDIEAMCTAGELNQISNRMCLT